MALTQITEKGIKDGELVNADVNSSAAIATSKISGAVTGIGSHGLAASATTDTTNAANISSGTLPAARIGDDSIVEDKLDISNTASDGQYLQYKDSTDKLTWASVSAGPSLANDANNRVITGTGSGLNGEANLTFDGSKLLINTTTEGSGSADDLTITSPDGTANAGITIRCGENNAGNIYFSDATSGTGEYAGSITYAHGSAGENLTFGTSSNARLLIDSSGNVKINDGDLIIGTGGHGIDFSAETNTAVSGTSADSDENLNHYEYGTWTAAFSSGGSNTNANCDYVRIGKFVMISGNIVCDDITTNSAVSVTGIPFSCINKDFTGSLRGYGIGSPTISTNTYANNSTLGSSDSIEFGAAAPQGAGWEMVFHNDFSNTNNSLRWTLTYITDS